MMNVPKGQSQPVLLRPSDEGDRDDAYYAETGAMEFEPWTVGLSDLPDADDYLEGSKSDLVLLRAAIVVNRKTKAELIDMIDKDGRETDGTTTAELKNKLEAAAESFKAAASVYECAESRLYIAACALMARDIGAEGQPTDAAAE